MLTLVPLVESRRVLERTRDQLQLDVELTDLEESLEVEIPYESNLLLMTFEWRDEKEGTQILDELTQAFMQEVAASRSTAAQKIHSRYESTLSQFDSRLSEARKALQEFNDEKHVVNLERDLANLQIDLQLMEATLASAQRRQAGQEAQLGTLSTNPGMASPGAPSAANGPRTATLDLERWRVLRDFISTEQQELQLQTQLEFKQREFDRAQKLHEQKYISDAELDQVAMQLQTLQSAYDPSLQPLRSQLQSIEQRVPGALSSNRGTSALLPPSASPALQIELSLLESQTDARYLEQVLLAKQARLDELLGARQEAQMLDDNVKLLNAERDRLLQRHNDLRSLLDPEPTEFVVMQPASPALEPIKDNRKKLLAGTFCACLALLLGPVMLWDLATGQKRRRDATTVNDRSPETNAAPSKKSSRVLV